MAAALNQGKTQISQHGNKRAEKPDEKQRKIIYLLLPAVKYLGEKKTAQHDKSHIDHQPADCAFHRFLGADFRAKLMLSNANLLILDEPTNHLDIVSKEILENALNSYTGTILYVSHDRYFINATATRIIELTNRNIVNYIGNYDYYLEKRDILTAKASPDAQLSSSDNTTKKDSKLSWQQSREEQNKLKKKQNEIKKTEIRIAEIEDRLSAIDTEYSDPSIGSNTARLMELHNESTQLKKELDELYEHWEELMDEM